ncbi:hypothetical protein T484DRAFT_1986232 [Baffinella frigidus]|nr:hypothetical protein T484DRAFT_1986232 [Cryptophyta sp. CCMP2293]
MALEPLFSAEGGTRRAASDHRAVQCGVWNTAVPPLAPSPQLAYWNIPSSAHRVNIHPNSP